MKLTIEVQLRNKYGRELIYPVGAGAELAIKLTGRKTFFTSDLATLQALGFEVVWVPASLDLKISG